MTRAAWAIVVGLSFSICAHAEHVWLVIGASDVSPATIANKAKAMDSQSAKGIIFQTHDCGDKKNVFAYAASITTNADLAKSELLRVKKSIKDAYIKQCDIKPSSLLSLKISVIDPSIADVPDSAVNWADEDRVSSISYLGDGKCLVIVRYYVNDPNDPLEGRRERVVLAKSATERVTLDDNCPSAGAAVMQQGRIALHCAREQAADNLLHSVLVFDPSGKKLTEVESCRNPKWNIDQSIQCESESVDANGKLKLVRKNVIVGK